METVSVGYRLVPLVTGAVLLPKMTVVPAREQVSRGGGILMSCIPVIL